MNDTITVTLSSDSYNFLVALLELLNDTSNEVVDIDDQALTDLIVEVANVG